MKCSVVILYNTKIHKNFSSFIFGCPYCERSKRVSRRSRSQEIYAGKKQVDTAVLFHWYLTTAHSLKFLFSYHKIELLCQRRWACEFPLAGCFIMQQHRYILLLAAKGLALFTLARVSPTKRMNKSPPAVSNYNLSACII